VKLYDYFRSSAAFRVRMALALKGLSADREFIHLRRKDQLGEAYKAVNPMGLVPVLDDDDGTVVTQSLAIIEYIDETRPGPRLLPADPAGRARVRAIALAIACDIHPLNNLRVLRHLDTSFGTDEATRTRIWYRHWIDEGLDGVEAMLAGQPATGRFAHADAPTLADCCIVPQLYNARRFGADMARWPTLGRVEAACLALPAVQAALPENQPDAE